MPLDTVHRAETPEGIELALRPAGLLARAGAYAIDQGIRFGVYIMAATGLQFLGGIGAALMLVLLFGLEWLYPVAFELGMSGATPGKRAVGLQVMMDSGLPVTPAASLVRNLLRTVDFLPGLYLAAAVCMLVRGDAKRLGDLAAGTLVVYADGARAAAARVPPATPMAPPRPLTPRQQAAIVAFAARTPRLTRDRAEELAQLASPSSDGPATPRLLSIAQWTLGRRDTA